MKTLMVLFGALAAGCASSHDASEAECLPGLWARPWVACDCSLVSTPECSQPTCLQTNTAMALRSDGSYMELALRHTTGPRSTASVIGTPSRGTWTAEEDELSRRLGATTSRQAFTCDSPNLSWGSAAYQRADEGLAQAIFERWDSPTIVAVPFVSSN